MFALGRRRHSVWNPVRQHSAKSSQARRLPKLSHYAPFWGYPKGFCSHRLGAIHPGQAADDLHLLPRQRDAQLD